MNTHNKGKMVNELDISTRLAMAAQARSAFSWAIIDLMGEDPYLARKEIAQMLVDLMDATEQSDVDGDVCRAHRAFVLGRERELP